MFLWMYKLHVCRYITSHLYITIHHCGTAFVSSVFFFSTIGLQYISHLKQKIVENNGKLQVYMYVCKMSKF